MPWTSSFRSLGLLALFFALVGDAVAQGISVEGCYDAYGRPVPACVCEGTCGGTSSGTTPYVMTEEDRERQRRFWGDGASYHVDPGSMPTMMELWRGKREGQTLVRRHKSWIRADAFSTLQGQSAMSAGNWALAEANYRLAIHAGAADASTWKGLAFALLRQGKPGEAIPVLEIALASWPRDRETRRLLVAALDADAHARFVAGDLAGARASWQRALKLDPDDPAAKANLPRAIAYESRTSAFATRPPDTAWTRKPIRLGMGGALEQLVDAAREGSRAVTAGSDEEAKARAALVFDDALKSAVILALPEPAAAPVAESGDAPAEPSPVPALAEAQQRLETSLSGIDQSLATKNAEPTSPARDAEIVELVSKRKNLVEQKESVARIAKAVVPPRRAPPVAVPAPAPSRPDVAPALVSVFGAAADYSLEKEYGAFASTPSASRRIEPILQCLAPKLGLQRSGIFPKFLSKAKVKRPRRYAAATVNGRLYVEMAFLEADPGPSDDEIAFVLAHELGHVRGWHGEKLLATTNTSAHVGDLKTENPRVRALAEQALRAGPKRAQELEADEQAVDAMKACGYQMSGVEAFFARLKKDEKPEAPHDHQVHDHPSAAERLERLRPRMAR